jgi:hypothetical protein
MNENIHGDTTNLKDNDALEQANFEFSDEVVIKIFGLNKNIMDYLCTFGR